MYACEASEQILKLIRERKGTKEEVQGKGYDTSLVIIFRKLQVTVNLT